MNIEYHKFWSHSLQQDMEFKIFGYAGKQCWSSRRKAAGFTNSKILGWPAQ
jgi:esterase/lipase superfamily enzyme